jgi:hypothetical protein
MSKYYEFKSPNSVRSPSIPIIREYLEEFGTLNCSDEELYKFWAEFSDEWNYGWLMPNPTTLESFAHWMATYKDGADNES